jgi:hypothetical protein
MNRVTAKSRHFFAFSTIKAKRIALDNLDVFPSVREKKKKKKNQKKKNGDKSGIRAKRMSSSYIKVNWDSFLQYKRYEREGECAPQTYPMRKERSIVPLSTHPNLFHKFK